MITTVESDKFIYKINKKEFKFSSKISSLFFSNNSLLVNSQTIINLKTNKSSFTKINSKNPSNLLLSNNLSFLNFLNFKEKEIILFDFLNVFIILYENEVNFYSNDFILVFELEFEKIFDGIITKDYLFIFTKNEILLINLMDFEIIREKIENSSFLNLFFKDFNFLDCFIESNKVLCHFSGDLFELNLQKNKIVKNKINFLHKIKRAKYFNEFTLILNYFVKNEDFLCLFEFERCEIVFEYKLEEENQSLVSSLYNFFTLNYFTSNSTCLSNSVSNKLYFSKFNSFYEFSQISIHDFILEKLKQGNYEEAKKLSQKYKISELFLLKQQYFDLRGKVTKDEFNELLSLLKKIYCVGGEEFVYDEVVGFVFREIELELKKYEFSINVFKGKHFDDLSKFYYLLQTTLEIKKSSSNNDNSNDWCKLFKYFKINEKKGILSNAKHYASTLSTNKYSFTIILNRHVYNCCVKDLELTKDELKDVFDCISELDYFNYVDLVYEIVSWLEYDFWEWLFCVCFLVFDLSGLVCMSRELLVAFCDVHKEGVDGVKYKGKFIKDVLKEMELLDKLSHSCSSVINLKKFVECDNKKLQLEMIYECLIQSNNKEFILFFDLIYEFASEDEVYEFVCSKNNNLFFVCEFITKYKLQNDRLVDLLKQNTMILQHSHLNLLKNLRNKVNFTFLDSIIIALDKFNIKNYSLSKFNDELSNKSKQLLNKLLLVYRTNDTIDDFEYLRKIYGIDVYLEYLKAMLLSKNEAKITKAEMLLNGYLNNSKNELDVKFYFNLYLEYFNNAVDFSDEYLKYAKRMLKLGLKTNQDEKSDLLETELRFVTSLGELFCGKEKSKLLPGQVRMVNDVDRRLSVLCFGNLIKIDVGSERFKSIVVDYVCNISNGLEIDNDLIMVKFFVLFLDYLLRKSMYAQMKRVFDECVSSITKCKQADLKSFCEFMRIVYQYFSNDFAGFDDVLCGNVVDLFYRKLGSDFNGDDECLRWSNKLLDLYYEKICVDLPEQ